jgi:ribulose-phosphate 3-epimerase
MGHDVIRLTQAGVEYMHMDVMDGDFVPNFGLGAEVFNCVRRYTTVPLDVHLMIREPSRHIEYFRELGAEIITVHPETDENMPALLQKIRNTGAKAGIALNPDTTIESVEHLLPQCDWVLVMTVQAGFAGQSFIEATLPKIEALCELSKQHGFTLCVDGNITFDRVRELFPKGVTNFVIGSALFRDDPVELLSRIYDEKS